MTGGPATLLVEGGHITSVRAWDDVPAAGRRTARLWRYLVVLPTSSTPMFHINDPGRDSEDFSTATRTAASGDLTTLQVDMPLNCIPKQRTSKPSRSQTHSRQWPDMGGLGRHETTWFPVTPIPCFPLVDAGVPDFKYFLIHSGIDGFKP